MEKLSRSIGLGQATAMVVGTIVGASIFVQPTEVSRSAPGFVPMLLVWTAAGALTWFGANVCAELASALPRSGGVYVFLSEAFSPAAGFLWGWAMFWSMHSGIIAAIAVIFARYVGALVPLGDLGSRFVAVGAIVLLSAVNYGGVRFGSILQAALTAAKIAAVAVLLIILFGFGTLQMPPLGPVPGIGAFARAVGAGVFAFGGWHIVTYSAGETRDPARTIPRALMIGVPLVVVIYLSLSAAYALVLPIDQVMTSTRIAADAAAAAIGPRTASAVALLVAVSAFGGMAGLVLAGPRVYYAMAEDGLLFDWAARVHPRFKTPHLAIAAQMVWTSVLVFTGTYRSLFSRVVYTEWIFFGVLAIGALRLRKSAGYVPAFHAWGFPAAPLVFALTCAAIVVNQVTIDPRESVVGLALVGAGLPVYALWKRRLAKGAVVHAGD
jgi:APA family basic amino acid/polyamine antiporter